MQDSTSNGGPVNNLDPLTGNSLEDKSLKSSNNQKMSLPALNLAGVQNLVSFFVFIAAVFVAVKKTLADHKIGVSDLVYFFTPARLFLPAISALSQLPVEFLDPTDPDELALLESAVINQLGEDADPAMISEALEVCFKAKNFIFKWIIPHG